MELPAIENTLQAWNENGNEIEVVVGGKNLPWKILQIQNHRRLIIPLLRQKLPQILVDRMQTSAMEALGQKPDLWHIHNHSSVNQLKQLPF